MSTFHFPSLRQAMRSTPVRGISILFSSVFFTVAEVVDANTCNTCTRSAEKKQKKRKTNNKEEQNNNKTRKPSLPPVRHLRAPEAKTFPVVPAFPVFAPFRDMVPRARRTPARTERNPRQASCTAVAALSSFTYIKRTMLRCISACISRCPTVSDFDSTWSVPGSSSFSASMPTWGASE